MLSIFDGRILEERIMRLTRNRRRLGVGPARVLMLAALSVLFVSAISLSMFSLELQARALAVAPPVQTLTNAVVPPLPPVSLQWPSIQLIHRLQPLCCRAMRHKSTPLLTIEHRALVTQGDEVMSKRSRL